MSLLKKYRKAPMLMSFALYTISIILCIFWYDWKLLVIMFLFVFANNIEQGDKRKTNAQNIVKALKDLK